MPLRIVADKAASIKFKQNLAGLGDRMQAAFSAAMNMAAAMIKQQGDADIRSAGNFGEDWTQSLHVNVEGALGNMRVVLSIDDDRATIFEEGGVIKGNPMLWIGLSGTDAEGVPASQYPGGLFSVNRKAGGAPLLFSIADKLPKYFGTESVTMPKKFHLNEIQASVMSNFRALFDNAFRGGAE